MIGDITYLMQREGRTMGVPCYVIDMDEAQGSFEETKEWLSELNFYDNVKRSAHLVLKGKSVFMYDTAKLIKYLQGDLRHLIVEVEVDGMAIPSHELNIKVDYWNVTVNEFNAKSLLWYKNNPKSIFKFAIADKYDWEDVNLTYILPLDISSKKVFLMPKDEDCHKEVVNVALANGVRFSLNGNNITKDEFIS